MAQPLLPTFGGLPFESPLQAQQRLRQQQLQQLAGLANQRQQGGFVLGQMLRNTFGGENPEVTQARQTEQILTDANTAAEDALKSGESLYTAQISSMVKAMSDFNAAGNPQAAAAIRDRIQALYREQRLFNLEQLKYAAATSKTQNDLIKQQRDLEDSLRKELDAQLEDTETVSINLAGLEENLQKGTAQGDVAAITAMAKILDPGSVVRPSEFESVAQAREGLLAVAAGQSVEGLDVTQETAARLVAWMRGQEFTDITRAQLIDAARSQARQSINTGQLLIADAQTLAEDRELSVDAVLSGRAGLISGLNVNPLTQRQLDAVAAGASLTDALALTDGGELSDDSYSEILEQARARVQ